MADECACAVRPRIFLVTALAVPLLASDVVA